MMCLEAVVRRRTGPTKHSNQISEDASLAERSEALRLGKLMRVDIFPSRFSARHQEDMVAHKRSWVAEGEEPDNDKSERHAEMCHSRGEGNVLPALVDEHLDEACGNDVHGQKSRRSDKGEKVSVVAFSNTIVQPDAVMIMALNAVVAHSTVMSTRGAPDITRSAVLHGEFECGSTGVRRLYLRPVDCRRSYP